MKKLRTIAIISVLVIALIAASLTLSGCTSRNDEQPAPPPQEIAIPNVIGQSIDDALALLTAQGFEVTINEENSRAASGGEVISQSLSGGEMAVRGSTVVITVSTESPADDEITENISGEPITRTFMIYIVGSDLETDGGLATGDLIEMLESDFDADWFNVLVYTGGARVWNNNVIPNDKNMIYEIIGSGMLPVWEAPATNMGNAQTLADFLTFGYENYDTDAYSLIFWNHGGGPIYGFGPDELFMDWLSLDDISAALEAGPFGRDNKLEIVGFDACFMSSIELAFKLYEYAEYLVASQEIEPGWGWDYSFLGDLKPEMSAEDIAERIIDTYFDFCEMVFEIYPVSMTDITLSCLDLSYVPDIEKALNALYMDTSEDLDVPSFIPIAFARSRTKEFGRSTTPHLLDLVDLMHLCEMMEDDYPQEAQALYEALESLIVYNRANIPNANGVSIYYPFANRESMVWQSALYGTFGFARNYTAFLWNFIEILHNEELTSRDMSRSFTAQESDTQFVVQLTPEQVQTYASATFYIVEKYDFWEEDVEQGAYYYLFSSSDVELDDDGMLRANYGGKVQKLRSIESGWTFPCLMKQVERTETYINYHVRIGLSDWHFDRFPRLNSAFGWLLLQTDPNGMNGRIMSVIPDGIEVDGIVIPQPPINIYDFMTARFVYYAMIPAYNSDGSLKPFDEWFNTGRGVGAEVPIVNELIPVFDFVLEDLNRDGEYYIVFNIMDVQGNTYSSNLIPINWR